jgi:hypothetical protein
MTRVLSARFMNITNSNNEGAGQGIEVNQREGDGAPPLGSRSPLSVSQRSANEQGTGSLMSYNGQ